MRGRSEGNGRQCLAPGSEPFWQCRRCRWSRWSAGPATAPTTAPASPDQIVRRQGVEDCSPPAGRPTPRRSSSAGSARTPRCRRRSSPPCCSAAGSRSTPPTTCSTGWPKPPPTAWRGRRPGSCRTSTTAGTPRPTVAALDAVAAAHPDDPLPLWMVAVECRQLHKNRIGIERYTRLLKTFDPGPYARPPDPGQPAAGRPQARRRAVASVRPGDRRRAGQLGLQLPVATR